MANQTLITVDLSNASVTSVNGFAPTDSPNFTGNVLAGSATSVTLPTNTTIGSVSATELGYLDGLTSNVQSQLNTINISSVAGDLTLYKDGGAASLIFEGATPNDFESSITATEPLVDYTFYLPNPSIAGSSTFITDTLTQTLTNKTLTSPTITSPTISSPTVTGTINSLNLPTATQSNSKIVSSYFYKVTADSPNLSTTVSLVPTGFPNATGLAVKAGKTYHLKIVGSYQTAAAAIIKHQLNFTGGSIGSVTSYNGSTVSAFSGTGTQNWQTSSTTLVSVTPAISATNAVALNVSIEGWFTATNDGYFYYDFLASASTVTLRYGTFMTLSEVG